MTREEIAEQLEERIRHAGKLAGAKTANEQIQIIWDALIDAEVRLAEREQELRETSQALSRASDMYADSNERVKELREALLPWDDMRAVEFDSNENTVLRLSNERWKKILALIRGAGCAV